ncbi:MAG: hypothetical protein HYU27_04085 [Acidobacteria bacterium]|nr:hypothetical protein [Acidobacteriota bacterium]
MRLPNSFSRWMLLTAALIAAVAPLVAAGQGAKPFAPPKTPWGDPDIQGLWPGNPMVGTPLERDRSLGTRAFLTDEEFEKRVAFAEVQNEIDTAEFVSRNPRIARGGVFVTCDQNYWDERGKPNRQASLVMDPPDGRIPPLTAEAQKLAAGRAAARKARPCSATAAGCHDSWEDESLWNRCITRGLVGSVLPQGYNTGNQIVQSPGHVVFRNEMIHEARVIPVDGRPHAGSNIRTWLGDSRGRWEGNTLVVETANFITGIPVGNTPASEDLRLIEKFVLADKDTLNYSITVEDPRTWTKPWTISFPLQRDNSYPVFEYACHEGNYYMRNALAGTRAEEAK